MKAFPYDPMFNPCHNGMDLRDYYASKAISISYQMWKEYYFSIENDSTTKNSSFQIDEQYPTLIAKTAYELADAMMEARK